MKAFKKPSCEVVRFNTHSVIATSGGCNCYDEEFGYMPSDCIGDVAYCACQINHIAGTANCTPCTENQGA